MIYAVVTLSCSTCTAVTMHMVLLTDMTSLFPRLLLSFYRILYLSFLSHTVQNAEEEPGNEARHDMIGMWALIYGSWVVCSRTKNEGEGAFCLSRGPWWRGLCALYWKL